MNLKYLANQIQEELVKQCRSYELMGEIDQDGGAWFFDINDDVCGFISCESNAQDINIPTVSVALRISEISGFTAGDIEALLVKNGDFFAGSLVLTCFDNVKLLCLQTRIHAEAYNPDDFHQYLNNLLHEASILLP
jgi:hypothetical protein